MDKRKSFSEEIAEPFLDNEIGLIAENLEKKPEEVDKFVSTLVAYVGFILFYREKEGYAYPIQNHLFELESGSISTYEILGSTMFMMSIIGCDIEGVIDSLHNKTNTTSAFNFPAITFIKGLMDPETIKLANSLREETMKDQTVAQNTFRIIASIYADLIEVGKTVNATGLMDIFTLFPGNIAREDLDILIHLAIGLSLRNKS